MAFRTLPNRPSLSLVGVALLATGFLVLQSAPACADDYEGYGDTGWTEDNKRDCCDDAVDLAQQDSAGQCRAAGGNPRSARGLDRGLCDWDVQGDDDDATYRCTAKAEVPCW